MKKEKNSDTEKKKVKDKERLRRNVILVHIKIEIVRKKITKMTLFKSAVQ